MRTPISHLSRTFVAGLLAALPLAATVVILVWALRAVYGLVGPGSLIGQVLVVVGIGSTGSELVGYLIGLAILIGAIYALGLLVRTRLKPVLADLINSTVARVPVVNTIYDLARRFVGLIGQRDEQGMKSMRPVWVHFGGPGGVMVLGLLSTPETLSIDGRDYRVVLVPTAPIPVGGGLLYVPVDWVTPASVGIDALTSVYVSMGITSKQHLTPMTVTR
jgi:uncharacterized membrane protein